MFSVVLEEVRLQCSIIRVETLSLQKEKENPQSPAIGLVRWALWILNIAYHKTCYTFT